MLNTNKGGIVLKNTLVSVIIPVYNGEKYIARCINSILNQSYKDLEIIIVDDNSKDKSAEIICEHMKRSNNIKYIKNEHTIGPAETRNKGLMSANSKYVLFLDCDDWLDLNCIEKAVDKFNSDADIDIVLWEIKTAFNYSRICSRYKYLYNNILDSEMALNLLSHTYENEFFLSPLLGCKLFKKSLLVNHNIVFPDTIYEDDMFTFLAFLYAKKIALTTGSCLYYYQHSESLTHHFTDKNITDFFKTFKSLYTYINKEQKDAYYKYLNKSLISMLDSLHNNVQNSSEQSRYKSMIFSYFYKNINVKEYYTYSFSLTI